MGRRRKMKIGEINPRSMFCKCGREIRVMDDDVTKVTCCFCSANLVVIPDGYIDDYDTLLEKEKEESKPKKRGRPRKTVKPVEKKDKVKTPKKEKKMENEKVETKKVSNKSRGKRGRKSTVGAKVLEFINTKKTDVKFDDILSVYSAERARLGKKGEPDIEKRNCLSTLYVMGRSNKIKVIEPKKVYASIENE